MSWEAKVALLREEYKKGAEDLTVRSRLALRWMESRGRFIPNAGAEYANESVQKAEPLVRTRGESSNVIFDRHSLWDKARQSYRGYYATDSMPWEEKLELKDDVTILNRYAEMLPNLDKSIRNRLHKGLYIDGGASGNESEIEGLNSFCGHSAANTAAADLIAYPNDTYREILCTPGQSGTWTEDLSTKPNAALAKDWPYGEGDPDWDYWAPRLVRVGSTSWADGATWAVNCEEVLREVISWSTLLADTTGTELVFISDGRMNTQFKAKMASRNYQLLPLPSAVDLGFPQVVNFEGLGIHSEFGISADTGFVWDFEHCELIFQTPSLLESWGPEWVTAEMAWIVLMAFRGNLRCKPKFFTKIGTFATS